MTEQTERRAILNDLFAWTQHRNESFRHRLFTLLDGATPEHRFKLAQAFPEEVYAHSSWRRADNRGLDYFKRHRDQLRESFRNVLDGYYANAALMDSYSAAMQMLEAANAI